MLNDLVTLIQVPLKTLREDGTPKQQAGTGYPIAEGLVITASHVLHHPDINTDEKRALIWNIKECDDPIIETITSQDIVYEDKNLDVALVKCKTPDIKELPMLSAHLPKPDEEWESAGYPNGGKTEGNGRIKTPASGKFYRNVDEPVQHLASMDHTKPDVWQGMSGAPVFKLNSRYMVGVLTHCNEAFPDRLMMLSIPYLLISCNKFKKHVNWVQHSDYFQTVVSWLKQDNNKTVLKLVIHTLVATKNEDIKECPYTVIEHLRHIPIPELISLILKAQKKTSSQTSKTQLSKLLSLLLPRLYDSETISRLLIEQRQSTGIISIPYGTDLSAEMLMACADKRLLDLIFVPASKKNTRLTAIPQKYRLSLPPETGSSSEEQDAELMMDDVYRRVGMEDYDELAVNQLIDDYLYMSISPRRRRRPKPSEKKRATQSELRRLLGDDQEGTYYWVFDIDNDDPEEALRLDAVVDHVTSQYPEIKCLRLDDFDNITQEEDQFYNLGKALQPLSD